MPAPIGSADDIARETAKIDLIAHATPAPSEPLQRIADATRALGRFAATTPDTRALGPIADALEALVARLPGGELPSGSAGASRFHHEADLDPERPLPNPRGTHPLLGCVSPVAPPLALRVDGDCVVADVTFDVRFEGNRGWAHGGFIAAGFDIVAVTAARLSGRGGPTGTLEVRYLAPTPIGEALRYTAWPERVEGRKIFVRARLERTAAATSAPRVTAEAEAVVIAVRAAPP